MEDLDQKRIALAQDIYRSAEGLTGGEVAEAMNRALNAVDEATIVGIRTEYLGDDVD